MVVDDHLNLAENIAEILEIEGCATIVAVSAEQALMTLECELVDAILTDYKLPGLSGAELIRELRRRGRNMPAVVMSAYSDDDTIKDSLAAGARDVLAKPVAMSKLTDLVADLRAGSC
jgi:CheY-like chemotaxis protein